MYLISYIDNVRNTISDNASYFNNHRKKVNSSFGIG